MKVSSTSSELAETLDSDSSSGLTVSIYQPIVGKAKPTKRISSVGLRIGTNFIMFGGFNNSRNILGDLWVLPLDYSTSIERANDPVTNDDSTVHGDGIPQQNNMTRSQYIQMLLQGSSYMEIMQNLQLFGMGLDDDDDDDVEDEGDYENYANEYYDEEDGEDDEDDDDDDEDDEDDDDDNEDDADEDVDDDNNDDDNANDDVAEDAAAEDASVDNDNDEAVDAEN